jgi:hypothetical protein
LVVQRLDKTTKERRGEERRGEKSTARNRRAV